MFLAGEDALDQFFCRHPDEFLDRPVEAAILDHESPLIFAAHLLCAAHEGPLDSSDAEFFGPRLQAQAELLVSAGRLRARTAPSPGAGAALGRETWVPRHPGSYPAAEVSLRSASPDSFAIVDVSSGELLGQTEAARAHSTVHDGAIYLHQGRSYKVRDLDLDHRRALVAPFDGDWYTQPKRETMTQIERLLDRRTALGVTLSFGEVSVTETVLAYQRRRLSDHAQIDLVALDLPETSFSTQALWFELDAAQLTDEPAAVANLAAGDGAAGNGGPALEGSLQALIPLRVPARRAACDRARPDRGAAADRDVRPLGHRRALDQPAPPDGRSDDLHLRRASRRHRHLAHGVCALRGALRGRAAADRRLRLQRGMPLLRTVPEVRQPQRTPLQGRRADAARANARHHGTVGRRGNAALIAPARC